MNIIEKNTNRGSRSEDRVVFSPSPRTSHPALRTSSSRRGILLLVVLSMLTLFLLIGTAFIVSANHYRQANKTLAKITATSNQSIDQDNLLEEVINQLVRDTYNQNSSLRFHSLLRDMYGEDGFMAHVDSVGWAGGSFDITGGQMIQFNIYYNFTQLQSTTNRIDPRNPTFLNQTPVELSPVNGAYNGAVITFLGGPAKGTSSRVTSYVPIVDTTTGQVTGASFRVIAPRKANGTPLTDGSSGTSNDFLAFSGVKIVVNGRAFNGTGVGLNNFANAGTPRLNVTQRSGLFQYPLALIPNALTFDWQNLVIPIPGGLPSTNARDFYGDPTRYFGTDWGVGSDPWNRLVNALGPIGLGGSDESYDAPDFQNMILAHMNNSPGEFALSSDNALINRGADGILGTVDDRPVVLPSFHRPALLRYWQQQFANLPSAPGLQDRRDILRRVLLRPNWLDHPSFDGSNPEFANQPDNISRLSQMIYGPWDVDNDNDGVRDSVWIDFGAPVMENSDGRLVKPLAAVLVLDMDGRLNLNAHGSAEVDKVAVDPNGVVRDEAYPPAQTLVGGVSSELLPHGQGYGPAEISLSPLMPVVTTGLTAAQRRERKWAWYSRFLSDAIPPDAFLPNALALGRRRIGKYGGRANDQYPGYVGPDLESQLNFQGVPLYASSRATRAQVLGDFGTPPDFKGRYAVPGLNALGQPVFEANFDSRNSSRPEDIVAKELNSDTPYEVDLSLGAARGESDDSADSTYSLAELERVLRAYDADAGSLPSRIWDFAGEFKDNAQQTTPNLDRLNLWRTSVTTDSYDLPVPSVTVPGWMLAGPDGTPGNDDDFAVVMGKPIGSVTFSDLLEYRIRVADIQNTNIAFTDQQVRLIVQKLLPPDLADGLRLDINRPLGNGRDDNNNGVVDEPGEWEDTDGNGIYDGELEAPYWTFSNTVNDATLQATGFIDVQGRFKDERILLEDRNNDGLQDAADFTPVVGADGQANTYQELVLLHNLRRQMLARDLYLLAMTLTDPIPVPAAGPTDSGYLKDRAARARRLAQWAINVVDFRDPDNIMTAFEYDVNPFDGWAVNGNTAEYADWQGTDLKPFTNDDTGGLVWGAERPELLITETLAWHDRRTENHGDEDPDNDEDGDGFVNQDDRGTVPKSAPPGSNVKIPDSDYDQRFVPKGAGFVEIYCPHPENPAASADTHALQNGNDLGINIAALDLQTGTSPCWRLMVYKTNVEGFAGPGKDPDAFEMGDLPKNPDRSVYFTGVDPGEQLTRPGSGLGWDSDGVAYFVDSTSFFPTVRPGRYLVVGGGESLGDGRYLSSLGSQVSQTQGSPFGVVLNPDPSSTSSVEIETETPAQFPTSLADPDPVDNYQSIASVAIVNQAWQLNPVSGIREQVENGFSFSEPAEGYPLRVAGSTKQSTPQGEIYTPILDIPLDDQRLKIGGPGGGLGGGGGGGGGGLGAGAKGGNEPFRDNELRLQLPPPAQAGGGIGPGGGGGANPGGLGAKDPTLAGRTIPGFSWVYLQRLANPLLPWNPPPFTASGSPDVKHDPNLVVNPYRTIDSMGVNVTVFNGLSEDEYRRNTSASGNQIMRFRNVMAGVFFTSVERGNNNIAREPAGSLTDLQGYVANRAATAISSFLNNNPVAGLVSNLWTSEAIGYTPKGISGLFVNNQAPNVSSNFRANPETTLGYLNKSFGGSATNLTEPAQQPFPWFTWNNRPFANANELLLVPAFRSSRLLQAFSFRTATNDEFKYDGDVDEVQVSQFEKLILDSPFGHLLNFFRSVAHDPSPTQPNSGDEQGITGLQRVLDYVQVPSTYVGTETWLSPNTFGNPTLPVTSVDDPRYLRQPPFNKVSSYREPGRVNINTLANAHVWDGGLQHRELADSTFPWDAFTNNFQQPNLSAATPYPGHTGPLFIDTTDADEHGILESRRGYRVEDPGPQPPTLPILDNLALPLDPYMPTFFANPFRSSDAADLVPLEHMRREGTDCTLSRSDQVPLITDKLTGSLANDITTAEPTNPNRLPPGLRASDKPLLLSEQAESYWEGNRNAYFGLQPLTRISSMVTTRSNVYAVWVTIGFFEVEEAPDLSTFQNLNDPSNALSQQQLEALYSKVYPEGYALGQEAGIDTGDVRRVRGFAVVDRTVPVAFEPGKNHNIEKAIRLWRRIE